jgi:UDP-N-acetylmuramate--alanine ligase
LVKTKSKREAHVRYNIDLNGAKKVHFIGIGGSSMNGLAQILQKNGYEVSGSDNKASGTVEHLQSLSMKIYIPNAKENIQSDFDLIIFTAAILSDNPEYVEAVKRGIPMMERSVLLGVITRGYNRAVCVAGSHGKTSTTALLAGVTVGAGLDPTVHIGAVVSNGMNNRIGESPYFILESCEYKNTFLQLHPYIGTILNIDADHIDFYGGMDGLIDSFATFARRIHPEGALVINADVPGYERIVEGLACRVVSFSSGARSPLTFSSKNILDIKTYIHYVPSDIQFDNNQPHFDVIKNNENRIRLHLPLRGHFNIMNALACFAVAELLGIAPDVIKSGIESAKGVKRRYEHKGCYNGVNIIDDYAHHPTEVRACLAAARREHAGRIICLFQPHLYSRTRDLMDDFAESFNEADKILLLPIFAAREPFDPTISSAMLGERLTENKKDVICFEDFYTAEQWLRKNLIPGELLITMGAGEQYLIGERLL